MKIKANVKFRELAPKLQHSYLLNPITALAFYHGIPSRDILLAGEDAWLKVFDVDSNRLLSQLRIFHSQSIHGIHIPSSEYVTKETSHILIWGGHSVAVLSVQSLQDLIEERAPAPPQELRAPDWIYDGIIYSSSGMTIGALITAHNEIVPVLAGPDGQTFSFGELTSPSRPILYSANLCLVSPDKVLVAAGTVFGEIIVWKYYLDNDINTRWEVLFVFTGHEGSIFGVSISPELELSPGVKVRLLASCSDDRTIRIWDVTDHPDTASNTDTASHPQALGVARETGFGGNSEAKVENSNDSLRCLAVEMGHVSRIWHARFTGRRNHHLPEPSPVEIYSFGEDSTRQRWELSLDVSRLSNSSQRRPVAGEGRKLSPELDRIGTLRNCGTSTCHIGKNIWSTALSTRGDSWLIASGGADGRIMVSGGRHGITTSASGDDATKHTEAQSSGYYDIDNNLVFQDFIKSVQTSSSGSVEAAPADAEEDKDTFHRYTFLSDDMVLATSARGRIFIGTILQSVGWKEVLVPRAVQTDLTSFHVVKSPLPGIAIIGSASGKIYLYSSSFGVKELAQFSSKVTDLILVGKDGQKPSRGGLFETNTVMVTILGQNHATMLSFDPATGTLTSNGLKTVVFDHNYSHYVLTSAALCGDKLLLGSRVGALTLYETAGDKFTVIDSRKDSNSKDAITSILPLPGSSTSFLTTSRDGKYRIYTISSSETLLSLVLQHEISPPMGIIEGASFTASSPRRDSSSSSSSSPDLILYGFRGQNFVAWNETARQELVSIECGGAHRPFSYVSRVTDPGQLRFVFTKVAHMRFYSQSRPALRVLKEGAHGREIRAVAVSNGTGYIATAAEDTTIRIWKYRDDDDNDDGGGGGSDPLLLRRRIECLAVLEKHSAGIQCLRWHGAEYLLSSAGNEELYIWRIARLDSAYQALAVVCEAVYPDRSVDGDLRIMNLDVRDADEGAMLISLVLSNSTLRTYRYSKDEGFQLLATGRYTGACLTQIRHLGAGDNNGGKIHVLTAATDGYLGIWSAASAQQPGGGEFSLAAVTKIHQSAVKSLDLVVHRGSEILVVTGGDDNAIGFVELVWMDERREFVVRSKSRVKSAHAAAVTGLSVLGTGEEEDDDHGTVEVATASNDQRVKVWRAKWSDGGGGVKVALVANRYSSVADAGDVEDIAPARVMVGGVGMEVWEVVGK
ncbi:WD40-repeat-containing domain protein [Echria macrotheca]|uniref:WD40-repeat-containing domain protein n=1 Tax=Echria macrotheca TaxID=438768 RepID=A0AAJ0BE07_9PEZI|nr:WD40-repeat-containing domain protein [Echria macrotheca]